MARNKSNFFGHDNMTIGPKMSQSVTKNGEKNGPRFAPRAVCFWAGAMRLGVFCLAAFNLAQSVFHPPGRFTGETYLRASCRVRRADTIDF